MDKHFVKYPYTDWGLEIKARLNGIRRTQGWLADGLHITPTYLSDMLRGKSFVSDERRESIDALISGEEKRIKSA